MIRKINNGKNQDSSFNLFDFELLVSGSSTSFLFVAFVDEEDDEADEAALRLDDFGSVIF